MPRSCRRSSTLRSESGNRTYNITVRRMISGLVLKYLNGEWFVICGFYKYTLLASTEFNLTVPFKLQISLNYQHFTQIQALINDTNFLAYNMDKKIRFTNTFNQFKQNLCMLWIQSHTTSRSWCAQIFDVSCPMDGIIAIIKYRIRHRCVII